MQFQKEPAGRAVRLVRGALSPPPGPQRIKTALFFGAACHVLFGLAVLSMMVAMGFGLTLGLGTLNGAWAWIANVALVLQFPLAHSALLSKPGQKLLARLAPNSFGKTLSTTTYAIIASLQLLALFWLWTPSGTIWWQADGPALVAALVAYAVAWLLLALAIYDAGIELQSGALGWLSLLQNIRPKFPDLPTGGLFAVIRQPIYVAFALTLWTVPTWTPDQLLLAILWTVYCLAAPVLKERRFKAIYGERFEAYRAKTPYAFPRFLRTQAPSQTSAERSS